MKQRGPDPFSRAIQPGPVADCYLGLLLPPPPAGEPEAGSVLAVLREVGSYLVSPSQRLAVVEALTCTKRNGSSRAAVRLACYLRRSGRSNEVLLVSCQG